MLPFVSAIDYATFFLCWLGIPAYIFYRPAKNGGKNIVVRFIISVFAVWLALILQRELIGGPVAMQRAAARGDSMYDGVGGNVAVWFGGWIPGVVSASIALVGYMILRYVRQRHKPSA
jgi:hypothetical protein